MDSKFKIERFDDVVRFSARDGWVDLQILGDGKAYIQLGTHNGTTPEVFGNRVWHLLSNAVPDLELRVVTYDDASDEFIERILVAAGFSKDGIRRGWQTDGQNSVIYSILAPELRHEVKECPTTQEHDTSRASVPQNGTQGVSIA